MKILVIPDTHAKPGASNRRFTWLGKFIADKMPDKIVCLGDFADMPSLSSYDVGKKSFQGRTYWDDIESALEAQTLLFDQLKLIRPKQNPRIITVKDKDVSGLTVAEAAIHFNVSKDSVRRWIFENKIKAEKRGEQWVVFPNTYRKLIAPKTFELSTYPVGVNPKPVSYSPQSSGYHPEMHLLGGNHDEGRINRVINDDSKLDGTIGIEDLEYEKFGWKYHPFKEVVVIDGIAFCHYFTSGLMDKPIGGANIGRTLLTKKFMSCIQGHTHTLNLACDTLPNGRRIWGMTAGCYFEHKESYVSQQAQDAWWRGLTMLHDVDNGDFNPSLIGMDFIKKRYG